MIETKKILFTSISFLFLHIVGDTDGDSPLVDRLLILALRKKKKHELSGRSLAQNTDRTMGRGSVKKNTPKNLLNKNKGKKWYKLTFSLE